MVESSERPTALPEMLQFRSQRIATVAEASAISLLPFETAACKFVGVCSAAKRRVVERCINFVRRVLHTTGGRVAVPAGTCRLDTALSPHRSIACSQTGQKLTFTHDLDLSLPVRSPTTALA